MFEMHLWPSARPRTVLAALALLQLAGCGSPEDRARNFFEHGMTFLAQHDNAKAAIELRNAVRLKKDLIEAWRALAQIDELNKDWRAVGGDLRTVLEIDRNDVAARLKLIRLLLLVGSPDEALSLVNSGIELDNRNSDLHALKAAVFLKLDDKIGAAREAQVAIELDSTNVDALVVLAVDRLGRGDTKGALSLLDSKSIDDARDLENIFGVQLLRVKIFEQTGDLRSAETVLRKLVESHPEQSGFRKLLINFYVDQHRPDDAERQLRALAAANPADTAAALELVRFLYAVKKAPALARQELDDRINLGGEVFPYQIALSNMDFADGNFADGKKILESLISAGGSPDHMLTAKATLAQGYFSRRSFDAAESLVAEILRDDGRNTFGLRLRASIHMERGQLDAAVTDLVEALNYQPRSTDLMLLLATAYERSGLMELAEKQFADATRASDFDVGVSFEYIAFLQRRGSIGRAEDILVELNKRRPDNIQSLSALAQVRLARHDWTGAQEVAESIRRIDNGGGAADQILGAALVGRGKIVEGIVALRNAYNAAPTAAQPMNSLVDALLKANMKDQAVTFLKSVLEKNPDSADALVLLGSIRLASGTSDQALSYFAAAVKAQPKNPLGYRALAEFYVNQKNSEEAIKLIRAGLQEQPDMFTLRLILASLLERKGDYDSAMSEYEFMLDRQPGNLIVVNNLASLLLDHRTDDASFRRAQSLAAILRKSQVPQFKDTLGWVNYRQGNYPVAISLFEEAATELPDQATVRYHLGMSYISTGQLAKASEQLKKALDLSPNNTLAEQIRTALKTTGSLPALPD